MIDDEKAKVHSKFRNVQLAKVHYKLRNETENENEKKNEKKNELEKYNLRNQLNNNFPQSPSRRRRSSLTTCKMQPTSTQQLQRESCRAA